MSGIKINEAISEEMTPWGSEQILVVAPGLYMLKKLFIKAGQKGGLQYHRLKDECGYVVSGKLIVRTPQSNGELSEKILKPGDFFHFPPGEIHQEEAVEDTVIIEAGLPIKNDRVRVESDFGLSKGQYGFPTSDLSDIEYL